MKILLSPAKSLKEDVDFDSKLTTSIKFSKESEQLIKKLKKLSVKKIESLMHVSRDLAELNYERFQQFSEEFTSDNSFPAAYVFSGAAYQGMDYTSMSMEDQIEGQDRLRILSGLYGILKPFDLIQPYRLEMGTRFQVTPKMTNLYKYWGDKIRQQLVSELAEEGSDLIVNLASSEYFKAAELNKMDGITVITPAFKDRNKKGEYKVNMHYAKTARGRMSRYIIEEKINEPDALKGYDADGYVFAPNESTETEFVFLRD